MRLNLVEIYIPTGDGSEYRQHKSHRDERVVSHLAQRMTRITNTRRQRQIRFSKYNPEAGFVAMATIVPSIFLKRLTSSWNIIKAHHDSFSSAQIATKDRHEMTTHAAWMNSLAFSNHALRTNKVFFPTRQPPFLVNSCSWWSNRPFERTRWLLMTPPYCSSLEPGASVVSTIPGPFLSCIE